MHSVARWDGSELVNRVAHTRRAAVNRINKRRFSVAFEIRFANVSLRTT